jgi:hypothetical protein
MTDILKNDTRRDDFFKRVRAYGRDLADGTDAKPKLALDACRQAFDAVIGPDDAKEVYSSYVDAYSNKSIHDHKGITQKASELRQIITLGALPNVDGPALLDEVTDILKQRRERELLSKDTFNAFLSVARAQIASPDTTLDANAIEDLIAKEEREKGYLEKLVAHVKAQHKLTEEGGRSSRMQAALDLLAEEIAEMGGEMPPLTKDEKAKAAFMRKAQALGMVVSAQ